jgi:hypothetical protein
MSVIQQIKDAEKISLSDTDILHITHNKCVIRTYEDLEKFDNIDDVLGKDTACVLLYQTKEDYGHWVSIFKVNNNVLEFFDSLGWGMDQELKFSDYNLRVHNGEKVPHLSNLVNNSKYHLIQNKIKLQKNAKDDNTCGRWAGLRVRLRHLPLNTFTDLFTKHKEYTPDFLVSAMTMLSS